MANTLMRSAMSECDQKRFQNLYTDFVRGSPSAVRELFAEDVVFHITGNSVLSGRYQGRRYIEDILLRTIEMRNPSSFDLIGYDMLISDRHIVMINNVKAKASEREARFLTIDVFSLNAEGHVREYWSFAEEETQP